MELEPLLKPSLGRLVLISRSLVAQPHRARISPHLYTLDLIGLSSNARNSFTLGYRSCH